jgi:hypothetical protein
MKKAILILMLSLMAIWTSETMAQQPIYDPFFEMFTSTVKAVNRELTTDGKGIMFRDYKLRSARVGPRQVSDPMNEYLRKEAGFGLRMVILGLKSPS